MWVELVGLVSLVDNGKRDSKSQPLQVADFFCKSDGLRGKVHLELQEGSVTSSLTGYVKYPSLHNLLARLHLQRKRMQLNGGNHAEIFFLKTNFFLPVFKKLLSIEFLSESFSILFQLLPFHMDLPPFTQHCLHSLEISMQLPVNLTEKSS